MSVDLDAVSEFVEGDNFIQFLLNNTTDFAVAAYILQKLKDCINEDRKDS